MKEVEIPIIEAESRLDGLSQHCRRHKCVPNPVLLQMYDALAAVRTARDRIRRQNGHKQWTLMAVKNDNKTYLKQWTMSKKTARRFQCDAERGLKAACWFCKQFFVKSNLCPNCSFYKCPSCGKCACDLGPEARSVIEISMKAIFGPNWKRMSTTLLPNPTGVARK